MTTLDRASAFAPSTRPVVRPAAILVRVANAVVSTLRAIKNRRIVYRLGEMSDWELADIGLRRSDLHVACNSPLGTDPTLELGVIATARALEQQRLRRLG